MNWSFGISIKKQLDEIASRLDESETHNFKNYYHNFIG